MKTIVDGHRYELKSVSDETRPQILRFIHKEPDTRVNDGTMITVDDGTTNEEVLEVLIDRMNFLNKAFPCRENSIVITQLETALLFLEKRTRDRLKRNVEGKHLK